MDKNINGAETVMIPVMCVWDATNDITRLAGMVRLAAELTSPICLKEDHDYGIFHDFFMDVGMRLDEASDALEKARQNPIVIKPGQVVKQV